MAARPDRKVLVIGAGGVLGGLTATAFRDAGWMVRTAARRPGSGHVHLDLESLESIVGAVRENELVVNTVPHPGLLAERVVLERGGALINTSALPAAAARSIRAIAGGARGTVVMNAGLAPGVTNLLAADLLKHHTRAQALEIVFTLPGAAHGAAAGVDLVHGGLTAVARHRTALIPLPPPFGERRCLGFAEPERAWLGGIAEGRVVRLYICLADAAAHERLLALNHAGTMNSLPRSILESSPPRAGGAPEREPVAHWLAVKTGDRRLAARTVECRGHFLHAARSTVVLAEALLDRRRGGGCFDPEEICTLAQIEPALRAAGVTIVSQPV